MIYIEFKKVRENKFVVLHHVVYEHYGSEEDQNLIPLCKEHHQEFHENYPLKKDMTKSTNDFIISKQEEYEARDLLKNL